jgi:hypothetical protein
MAAYNDAFAVRERRGDPRVVPGFHCSFLPGMPSSPTPGSSTSISRTAMPTLAFAEWPPARHSRHSRNPFRAGGRFRGFIWFASATACQVARPPCTDQTGTSSLRGLLLPGFQRIGLPPVAGYNYNSDWTPLLTGLSPTGIAASLAARSFATDALGVAWHDVRGIRQDQPRS